MKTLIVTREASNISFICDNGDVYDSSATLYDEKGNTLWHSEYVNTDSTEGYKGGKLSNGGYYGIVGYRKPKDGQIQGKRVIKIFLGHPSAIKTDADLTDQMMTLPSDIKNPNHNGLPVMRYIQMHDGVRSWDGSHGCLTVYKYATSAEGSDWDRLMEGLVDNEIIKIILQ